jgi:hypothetical protein
MASGGGASGAGDPYPSIRWGGAPAAAAGGAGLPPVHTGGGGEGGAAQVGRGRRRGAASARAAQHVRTHACAPVSLRSAPLSPSLALPTRTDQEPRSFPSGDSHLGHLTSPKPRTPTRCDGGGSGSGSSGGAPPLAPAARGGGVPSLFGRSSGAGGGSGGGAPPPGGFFGSIFGGGSGSSGKPASAGSGSSAGGAAAASAAAAAAPPPAPSAPPLPGGSPPPGGAYPLPLAGAYSPPPPPPPAASPLPGALPVSTGAWGAPGADAYPSYPYPTAGPQPIPPAQASWAGAPPGGPPPPPPGGAFPSPDPQPALFDGAPEVDAYPSVDPSMLSPPPPSGKARAPGAPSPGPGPRPSPFQVAAAVAGRGKPRAVWAPKRPPNPFRRVFSPLAFLIFVGFLAAMGYYYYVRVRFTLDMGRNTWWVAAFWGGRGGLRLRAGGVEARVAAAGDWHRGRATLRRLSTPARRPIPYPYPRWGVIVLIAETIGLTAVIPYGWLLWLRTAPAGSRGLPVDDGRVVLPPEKRFNVHMLVPCYKVGGRVAGL